MNVNKYEFEWWNSKWIDNRSALLSCCYVCKWKRQITTNQKRFSIAQWAKSPKTVWRSACLLIRHSKCSAMQSKIHSYRLPFRSLGSEPALTWNRRWLRAGITILLLWPTKRSHCYVNKHKAREIENNFFKNRTK